MVKQVYLFIGHAEFMLYERGDRSVASVFLLVKQRSTDGWSTDDRSHRFDRYLFECKHMVEAFKRGVEAILTHHFQFERVWIGRRTTKCYQVQRGITLILVTV